MTCFDELAAVQRQISEVQARLNLLRSSTASYTAALTALQGAMSDAAPASTATGSTGPATRPTTQPQEERRADGGELAQYAALSRDITDMEDRLARLEAR